MSEAILDQERAASRSVVGTAPSASNRKDILRSRAKQVAQKPASSVDQTFIEVVEFLIGSENYAFELACLREVCPLADVTFIPCAPPYLVGVINLRGQIIPILDLESFLGISQKKIKVFNKAIILQYQNRVIGCLADEVIGARKIASTAIQQALNGSDAAGGEHLKGITSERVIVLDAGKVLLDSRLNRRANKEVAS